MEDYTNAHDTSVIPSILHPSYRFSAGGTTVGYDAYVSMVQGAFARVTDLELVVHDLFTNGERLAMRFSERGSSAGPVEGYAAWSGISMYRWNGSDRLTECKVEQDFYGIRQQLATGQPGDMDPPMLAPWMTTVESSDPVTEHAARRWASSARSEDYLDVDTVVMGDVFSSGAKAAIRLRRSGSYTGGLVGVPKDRIGARAWIDVMAVVDVVDGRVSVSHVVADRSGLRKRLRDRQ